MCPHLKERREFCLVLRAGSWPPCTVWKWSHDSDTDTTAGDTSLHLGLIAEWGHGGNRGAREMGKVEMFLSAIKSIP